MPRHSEPPQQEPESRLPEWWKRAATTHRAAWEIGLVIVGCTLGIVGTLASTEWWEFYNRPRITVGMTGRFVQWGFRLGPTETRRFTHISNLFEGCVEHYGILVAPRSDNDLEAVAAVVVEMRLALWNNGRSAATEINFGLRSPLIIDPHIQVSPGAEVVVSDAVPAPDGATFRRVRISSIPARTLVFIIMTDTVDHAMAGSLDGRHTVSIPGFRATNVRQRDLTVLKMSSRYADSLEMNAFGSMRRPYNVGGMDVGHEGYYMTLTDATAGISGPEVCQQSFPRLARLPSHPE
jgi:hypothetical protein